MSVKKKTASKTKSKGAASPAPVKKRTSAKPAPSAGVATYLYCLLASKARPSLAESPDGVPLLGEARVLDAGDGLWLVVADAPLSEYAAEPIERRLSDIDWVGSAALGHEAVIEHATSLGTVIPMKLFTLFDGDARAVAHVKRSRGELDRVLERIAGRTEWGLRVRLDEPRALARLEETSAAGVTNSGSGFLLRKKAEQDARKNLFATARERAEVVFDALVEDADDARRRPPTQADVGARILLEAAFLVPHAREKRFVAAVERAAKGIVDEGYELELTGPWPAYHFISEGG